MTDITQINAGFSNGRRRFRALAGDGSLGSKYLGDLISKWTGVLNTADQTAQAYKKFSDYRAWDAYENYAPFSSAISVLEESAIGTAYILNARPNYESLGLDEAWNDKFQDEVETKFTQWAMSSENWIDSSRKTNFIGMLRQCMRNYLLYGEVLVLSKVAPKGSPFATCFQIVDTNRIVQPNTPITDPTSPVCDMNGLRVNKDTGEVLGVWLAPAADNPKVSMAFQPTFIPCKTSWGRKTALYYGNWKRAEQTRGMSSMSPALSLSRAAEAYKMMCLLRGMLNASIYATIESDLPSGMVYQGMSAVQEAISAQMEAIDTVENGVVDADGNVISEGAGQLTLDGARVAHLPPNSKLKVNQTGKDDSLGTNFERSLLCGISSVLGISYEEVSNDYSNTNYSSAKASGTKTYRMALSLRMFGLNPFANMVFQNWFEEAVAKGEIESMKEANVPSLWDDSNRAAFTNCEWIGQGRAQLDELKDTQAAKLRLASGLSNFEREYALMGKDWRQEFKQIANEVKFAESLGMSREQLLGIITGQPAQGESEPAEPSNAGNPQNQANALTGEPRKPDGEKD